MIRIESVDVEQQLDEELVWIQRVAHPTQQSLQGVGDTIRGLFAENFDREGNGSGAWVPLARSTQRERQRLGYPPSHPILVRRGAYRDSFVRAGAPGNVDEFDGDTYYAGSDDYRVGFHESEAPRTLIPARRVIDFDSMQQDQIGESLDRWVENG